jgi:lipoprotein NlpI
MKSFALSDVFCGPALLLVIVLFSALPEGQASAQSVSSYRAKSLSALMKGNRDAAVESADAMIKAYPEDTRATLLAADIYLRAGKPLWATRMFDRYIEDEPKAAPELWQRGIALYLIGDYDLAVKQFEDHRRVNPNDVENAAWHFLCVSKAESFAQAREKVLPAPNDPRVPMKQVMNLLKTGNTEAVDKAVNATSVDSDERVIAQFYGDFYLGLYADAKGDRASAAKLLNRSVEDAPRNYMGDVARVYADHLSGKLDLDPKGEKLELPKPGKSKKDKLGKSILSDDEA